MVPRREDTRRRTRLVPRQLHGGNRFGPRASAQPAPALPTARSVGQLPRRTGSQGEGRTEEAKQKQTSYRRLRRFCRSRRRRHRRIVDPFIHLTSEFSRTRFNIKYYLYLYKGIYH